MLRRTFLSAVAGSTVTTATAHRPPFPIIDSHVHLYDPTRPQGVPWPRKETSLYRTFLPADYRRVAEPLGVVGMIEMECSNWVEDNYWVLDVAARDTVVVGTIGNLFPGKPDFREHLSRLHKNPLFRGIRFAYLWGGSVANEEAKPEFISDLKEFAQAGLTLDTFGPAHVLMDVVRITDKIPSLRVVIDHVAGIQRPREPAALADYEEALREIAKRPNVYAKVSQYFRRIDDNGQSLGTGGRIPRDLEFYRSNLDVIYGVFGPDRVVFASDWTNGELMGTFAETLSVVQEYFASKGQEVAEKFFWKNSMAAYHWVKRQSNQPPLNTALKERKVSTAD